MRATTALSIPDGWSQGENDIRTLVCPSLSFVIVLRTWFGSLNEQPGVACPGVIHFIMRKRQMQTPGRYVLLRILILTVLILTVLMPGILPEAFGQIGMFSKEQRVELT